MSKPLFDPAVTDRSNIALGRVSRMRKLSTVARGPEGAAAGGAARAIVYALKLRGMKRIFLTNRTKERAVKLTDLPGALAGANLLINTASVLWQEGLYRRLCRLPRFWRLRG